MTDKIDFNITSRVSLLLVAAVFVVLGIATVISVMFVDAPVYRWISNTRFDFVKNIFVVGFCQLGKAWVPIWLLLLWGYLKKNHKVVISALISLLLISPVIPLIKDAVARPRPADVAKMRVFDSKKDTWKRSWSFPSGDTATVFAAVTAVVVFTAGLFPKVILFLCALAVGILRVLNMRHYPSDVIAGAAVGIIAGISGLYIARKILCRYRFEFFFKWIVPFAIVILPIASGVEKYNPIWLFLKPYGVFIALWILIDAVKVRVKLKQSACRIDSSA